MYKPEIEIETTTRLNLVECNGSGTQPYEKPTCHRIDISDSRAKGFDVGEFTTEGQPFGS